MVFSIHNPSSSRFVRMLKSAMVIALIAIAVIIFITFIVGFQIEHAKFPSLLGNRAENIKNVQSRIDPNNFTFVVLGDVKDNTKTFESLMNIAQLENPSFVIILGDLVSHYNIVDHKLFAYEISDYASKTPFFIVPGNHDIGIEDSFGLKDFEQFYGPAQYSFTIGSDLFVFLNDLPEYNQNGECLDFLENALKSSDHKRTFVFMHIPISGINELVKSGVGPDSGRFKEIAKKYHIDYVFAGDHHGYIKTEYQGTNYIVTGGGGSRLRGSRGSFHHFMEINVEKGKISETVITVQQENDGLELLERNIATYLWAAAKENKLIFYMGIVYCISVIVGIIIFLKKIWMGKIPLWKKNNKFKINGI